MKRSEFLLTGLPTATGAVTLPATAHVNRHLGVDAPLAPYGSPAATERDVVRRSGGSTNLAFTPLDRQLGTTTPSGLAFVRNHAGVPRIDPRQHRLLVHGLVTRPLTFALSDLLRFPAVERSHFIECAGNSASGWQRAGRGVQFSHGLVQSARWTGVPLRTILNEVGVGTDARCIVVEGADGSHFDRSIPLDATDDTLIVYGQNGEMLRPEQGYPLRLLVPGFEGSTNVKWLRRLKLVAKPVYSREETAQYSERFADGKIHLFEFVMEVKSVIVSPSPGQRLTQTGAYEGRGFAWSGRGRIAAVDVSRAGAATWTAAALDEQQGAKSFVGFTFPFAWDGTPATLVSRAKDATGAVQPTAEAVYAARGGAPRYHANAIARWGIASDGRVRNLDG
jgi:sulfane dehydrogenase subunit SoxC